MIVVLPAPFGPSRPSTVPGARLEIDTGERSHGPVGLDEPADADGGLL